ncbi:hypothetical protein [Catenuloplanes japonicus]|uniref:hypothetical protein n=1 Tax=Catenuloplanes japonicus TaxID=33876 RepID=UPI000525D9B6|nr:hypothetical protein [Catenuloplanes japonicus]
MPDQPVFIDANVLAQLLREQADGEWMRWEGGPAGIPDATLWAHFKPDADGRKVMVGMVLLTDGITSADLRRIPVGELEKAYANRTAEPDDDPATLPPLRRGDSSYDEFLRLLARHYLAHAQRTTRPAAAIVKESGEKSATVHGWIHDARQRGILPEAQRGKRIREIDVAESVREKDWADSLRRAGFDLGPQIEWSPETRRRFAEHEARRKADEA